MPLSIQVDKLSRQIITQNGDRSKPLPNKALEILSRLALASPEPVGHDALTDKIWPQSNPNRQQYLYHQIWLLRNAFAREHMPFRIHRTAQGGYYLLPCTPVKTRRSKRSCRWALLTATMATAGMLLLLVMWPRFSSEPLTNKRIDDVYTALGEPGRKRLGAEIST